MISLIVAYAKNRVIGNNGCIPWKIKGEQRTCYIAVPEGNLIEIGSFNKPFNR